MQTEYKKLKIDKNSENHNAKFELNFFLYEKH